MKKFYIAVLACLMLANAAHADLEGDEIFGSATGLTSFGSANLDDPASATVVFDFFPEFTGAQDVYGDNSLNFETKFIFFGDESGDKLIMTFGLDHSDFSGNMSDFSVTFTDLDYLGFPNFVLKNVTSDYDTMGTGDGLDVLFTDDSLTLKFKDFYVPKEFREIDLNLVFTEPGGPNTPVVPVPAALPLGALGMAAVVLKRKYF